MFEERILGGFGVVLRILGFFPEDGSPRQQGYSSGSEGFADTRVHGGGREGVTATGGSNLDQILPTCPIGEADQPPIDTTTSQ